MKSSGKLEDFFPQKPFLLERIVLSFSWQNYNISHSIFIYRAPPKKKSQIQSSLVKCQVDIFYCNDDTANVSKKEITIISYFMIIPFKNQLQGPTTNLVFKSTAIKQ